MSFQTEFDFTLPMGYIDQEGNVHKKGTMRLATAMDEIAPLRDMRVRTNQAYLVITLLARVVTRLGTLSEVNTGVVENLFAGDLRFLEEMYNRINEDEAVVKITCPECGAKFDKEFGRLGE